MNLLLRTDGERNRRPSFVIFVVWSDLIVGRWLVVVWSRRFCLEPVEVASFLFLVLFKDWGCRVSPRSHLFVSDINQGNEEAGWVQDFLA